MARIKINDLPLDSELRDNQMEGIFGGIFPRNLLPTQMENVRNKRSEFQTMFENFDQKANQLFNILSTVLKTSNEMKSCVVRNIQ